MSRETRPHVQSTATDLSPPSCAPVRDAVLAQTRFALRAAAAGGRWRRSSTLLLSPRCYFEPGIFATPQKQSKAQQPPCFKCLFLVLHDCCFGKRVSAPAPAAPTRCEVRPSSTHTHRFIPIFTYLCYLSLLFQTCQNHITIKKFIFCMFVAEHGLTSKSTWINCCKIKSGRIRSGHSQKHKVVDTYFNGSIVGWSALLNGVVGL